MIFKITENNGSADRGLNPAHHDIYTLKTAMGKKAGNTQ
jgi:hypothetical protein